MPLSETKSLSHLSRVSGSCRFFLLPSRTPQAPTFVQLAGRRLKVTVFPRPCCTGLLGLNAAKLLLLAWKAAGRLERRWDYAAQEPFVISLFSQSVKSDYKTWLLGGVEGAGFQVVKEPLLEAHFVLTKVVTVNCCFETSLAKTHKCFHCKGSNPHLFFFLCRNSSICT